MKELDKFYTKPKIAEDCYDTICHYPFRFVELTAGDGAFSSLVECDAYDLAPEADGIVQQDAFDWEPAEDCVVFGNPPFGKSSSLAISLFNHCAQFDKVKAIAWIIPRSWRRWSVQRRLNENFDILIDNTLPFNSFTSNGEDYGVGCCWQVWSRGVNGSRLREKPRDHHPDIQFNSDDYNYKIISRGSKAGEWIERDSDRIKWDSNVMKVKAPHPFPITTDLTYYSTGINVLTKADVVESYMKKDMNYGNT